MATIGSRARHQRGDPAISTVDVVKAFLRAQNLEQLGRIDEAISLYEDAIEARFDAIGPYDRLIALYSNRAAHTEVVRVADAALEFVHTAEDKREWYRSMRAAAHKASTTVPAATPKGSSQ